MGEIVGAGIVAHVPTMVMDESIRRDMNNGHEITLVPGMEQLVDEVLKPLEFDTVVVFDSHWFTTFEFVVSAHERRSGKFTSSELPRGMCQIPYDFPGDPELARLMGEKGTELGTWVTPVDDPYLPIYYATTNLLPFIQGSGTPQRQGAESESWLSVSIPQTAETDDFLLAGKAIGAAIAESDRKVILLASGALSHKFWPLKQLRQHEPSDPIHIRSDAHRAADYERLEWMAEGRHDLVLDTMDEFLKFSPEGRFGHYLMMVSALGGRDCAARGRLYGEYENAVGTGQAHVWFEPTPSGWTLSQPSPA